MASRDYIIRQIEEMGIFLAILLHRILKLKEENQQPEMEAVVRESLLKHAEIDIDQIVSLGDDDFLDIIKQHFTSRDQLEKLADLLKMLGENITVSVTLTRLNYLRKSLTLFSYLQESTTVYSLDWNNKIQNIRFLLLERGVI
jgi:hypothetical protein